MKSRHIIFFTVIFGMINGLVFKCPSFSSSVLPQDACALKIVDQITKNYIWKFSKCNSTHYCKFDYSKTISNCTLKGSKTGLLPGENCSANIECFSLSCVNGFCSGKLINEKCSSNKDCIVGAYCAGLSNNKKCQSLLKIGATCQNSDNKCVGNAVCYAGTCKKMKSIEIGSPSDNHFLCSSGYTVYTSIFDHISKCHNPTKLLNPSTYCKMGESCNYQSDNYTMSLPCRCGINPDGNGICSNGTKDLEKYLENFLNFVNKIWEIPKCHIENPYFCLNVQQIDGYNEAYVGLQMFHESVYLNKSSQDDTIESIIRPDFWIAYSKIPDPPIPPPSQAEICGYFIFWLIIFLVI